MFLPSALWVPGKSNAMRGGLLIVNPAGGLASGCLRVMRTTILPPRWPATLIASMLLAAGCADCAQVVATAAALMASSSAAARIGFKNQRVLFMALPPEFSAKAVGCALPGVSLS